MKGIDHFYREVMGFDLKKVEIGPTPQGGWAKHFFYEIEPDRFIAFWICMVSPTRNRSRPAFRKRPGCPNGSTGFKARAGA